MTYIVSGGALSSTHSHTSGACIREVSRLDVGMPNCAWSPFSWQCNFVVDVLSDQQVTLHWLVSTTGHGHCIVRRLDSGRADRSRDNLRNWLVVRVKVGRRCHRHVVTDDVVKVGAAVVGLRSTWWVIDPSISVSTETRAGRLRPRRTHWIAPRWRPPSSVRPSNNLRVQFASGIFNHRAAGTNWVGLRCGCTIPRHDCVDVTWPCDWHCGQCQLIDIIWGTLRGVIYAQKINRWSEVVTNHTLAR